MVVVVSSDTVNLTGSNSKTSLSRKLSKKKTAAKKVQPTHDTKHRRLSLTNGHAEKNFEDGSDGEARKSAGSDMRERGFREDDFIETRERRSGRIDDDSDDGSDDDFNDFNDEQKHK